MTDLYHEMRDNMTLPAAVASLKNGWGARRIGWPEWMYIEQLQPTGDLIIWGKPRVIAKDNKTTLPTNSFLTFFST